MMNTALPNKVVRNHTFFKFCKDCDVRFQPFGRTNKICEKCLAIRKEKNRKLIAQRIAQRKIINKLKGGKRQDENI